MNHPLFVGHFDEAVRSIRPKVMNCIDIPKVLLILVKYCDLQTIRSTRVLYRPDESFHADAECLGQIENEDIQFKSGYLICPWVRCGVNHRSVSFINELHGVLGVQIYEPGDAVFLSPEQLNHGSQFRQE